MISNLEHKHMKGYDALCIILLVKIHLLKKEFQKEIWFKFYCLDGGHRKD